jgi:hypothetical protein
MDDETPDPTPRRNVGEMRRRLATKRKAFAEPAPIGETLGRAQESTQNHLDAGRLPKSRRRRGQ